MDNKKKLTIVIALLAVVCVFAALVFSGIIDLSKIDTEEPSTGDNSASYSDTVNYKATGTNATPYLSTPVDGIYYTISVEGEVKFYRFENNAFTNVEATGTYTTTVTLSEENVSADITYLQIDNKICGYGLYTVSDGSYTLNPYAFFYLRDYGENYASASSSGCMLYVDTTEDDFYSEDKIYEESFFFNFESSKSTRALAESSRTIGINGAKRNDYFNFTDKIVDGSVDHQLFLSGRFYSESDATVDLMRSGGSGNNTDNIRIAQDVLGNWAEYTDEGIRYITTDENGDVAVMLFADDEATAVKTFKDVKRDDILVSGDYIYVVSQNLLYSIADDKEIKIKTSYDNFTADMFVIEDNTLMLRGYIDKRYAAMIIASADNGKVTTSLRNELCRSFVSPSVVDGQVIVHVQNSDKFNYYIF